MGPILGSAASVIDHVKKLNVDVQRSHRSSKAKPSTLVVEGDFSFIGSTKFWRLGQSQ